MGVRLPLRGVVGLVSGSNPDRDDWQNRHPATIGDMAGVVLLLAVVGCLIWGAVTVVVGLL